MFQEVTAPDVSFIDEDLRELKSSAEDLLTTFADLATACRDQEAAHRKLRADLAAVLTEFAEDIGKEILVTVASSVAASVVSFGMGGAAVAAIRTGKFATKVKHYVDRLRKVMDTVKLKTAVTLQKSVPSSRQKLQRIIDLVKQRGSAVKNPLGPGVKIVQETPLVTNPKQIEAKFKHAEDFGIAAPRGKEGFRQFDDAVKNHVDDPATLHIDGTYRGNPAILNYNPNTGLVVVQSPSGEFVSGWKLSRQQAQNVLDQGKLGGG